jgi:hypothetical protein
MKAAETTMGHPRMGGEVSFRISYDHGPEHILDFADVATVVIETGEARLQTYGTALALRMLAANLLAAASAVEEVE